MSFEQNNNPLINTKNILTKKDDENISNKESQSEHSSGVFWEFFYKENSKYKELVGQHNTQKEIENTQDYNEQEKKLLKDLYNIYHNQDEEYKSTKDNSNICRLLSRWLNKESGNNDFLFEIAEALDVMYFSSTHPNILIKDQKNEYQWLSKSILRLKEVNKDLINAQYNELKIKINWETKLTKDEYLYFITISFILESLLLSNRWIATIKESKTIDSTPNEIADFYSRYYKPRENWEVVQRAYKPLAKAINKAQ